VAPEHPTSVRPSWRDTAATWLLPASAAALALVVSVLLLTATTRGLDLTDEGFYLLTASDPLEYIRSSTQAPFVWSAVLDLVGSVAGLRVVRVLLLAGAGAWLGIEVARRGRALGWSESTCRAAVVCTAVVGLVPATWLPQSPGYNDLAVLSLTGLCTVALGGLGGTVQRAGARLAIAGALWWLLLLAKWPSAVVVAGLSAMAALPQLRRLDRRKVVLAASLVGAVLACALVTQLFVAPLGSLASGVRTSAQDVAGSHDASGLLPKYLSEAGAFLRGLLLGYWWALAASAVAGYLLTQPSRRRAGAILVCGAVALAMLKFAIDGSYAGGAKNVWLFSRVVPTMLALVLATVVVALASSEQARRDLRSSALPWAAVALLVLAPFIGAVGSNNPLLTSACSYGALWFAAMLLALGLVAPSWTVGVIGLAVAAVVGWTAVSATWAHPYRQTPLREVDSTIESGPAAGLRVDRTTAELIGGLQDRSVEGASVIVLWKQPGLVFAVGATQPIHAWIPVDEPGRAAESLVAACTRSAPVVLVYDDDPLPSEVREAMESDECAPRGLRATPELAVDGGATLHVIRSSEPAAATAGEGD
jgi:hypothetical protein